MQKNKNYIYIFLSFLIVCALIFFLFRLPLFSPVVSFAQRLILPILPHNAKVQNDSPALSLSQKLVDQSKTKADLEALRDQFQTSSISTQSLIEAKIVGMPSFVPGVTLPEYFILNKGAKDKVTKGHVVIYKDNIVGFVVEVSENFSKVELVTNSDFSQTAQIVPSNILGVAKGQGAGRIILDNVILSADLKKDDLVVTKGNQDINGEGILQNLVIGKIVSVNKNPSSLFQVAKVESLLDFTSLSTVFIVK